MSETITPESHARVELHEDAAVRYAARAEALADLLENLRVGSEEWRRVNGRLGVHLKLASVHAHLAVAIAGAPAGWDQPVAVRFDAHVVPDGRVEVTA